MCFLSRLRLEYGLRLRHCERLRDLKSNQFKPVVVAIVLTDDRHVCCVVVSLHVVDVDLAHGAP